MSPSSNFFALFMISVFLLDGAVTCYYYGPDQVEKFTSTLPPTPTSNDNDTSNFMTSIIPASIVRHGSRKALRHRRLIEAKGSTSPDAPGNRYKLPLAVPERLSILEHVELSCNKRIMSTGTLMD
ncbi:hypothetical protein HAX54_041202 [Datura stramonium]|uniref:Secreted protein n=1 Tax=Datura stramonium TaxID=4076 RepID=A0ABS8SL61_DATST|nr:hypothetical protein [Datura stramonium]